MSDRSLDLPVAVIGGGLAGLVAAWKLTSQGHQVVGFEATSRLGGLIQTERWQNSLYEHGPDGFLLRKPQAVALCEALGITLQPLSPTPERIYLANRRGIFPLPKGLGLIVPTDWGAFFGSPLMSLSGRLRVAWERWVRPAQVTAQSQPNDESVGSFIQRRFGREALTTLAEPLLGGVWNTDPNILSLQAAFPQYAQLEAAHGSVLRGLGRSTTTVEGGGLSTPVLGMEELPRQLVAASPGVWATGVRVLSLDKLLTGFRLNLGHNNQITAQRVILAVPPFEAAKILKTAAPEAATQLSQISSRGIGTVSMTFRATDFVRPLDAWGVLFTRESGVRIDGLQWSSAKWDHRADPARVVVRAFFGGFRNPEMLGSDSVISEVLVALAPWLKPGAQPEHSAMRRWQAAFPQVAVGHLERLAKIEAALPQGLRLAGQGFHGVGIPAVIESALSATQF